MEKDLKLALGKILGEVYDLERRIKNSYSVSQQTIFGLVNGFEETIDKELTGMGMITEEDVRNASSILERYENDSFLLQSMVGFSDMEAEMGRYGIDWFTAKKIVTMLRYERKYPKVIEKLTGGTEHGFW